MKLTSIDVQQQRFRKGLRGYAPTEVDEFLNSSRRRAGGDNTCAQSIAR